MPSRAPRDLERRRVATDPAFSLLDPTHLAVYPALSTISGTIANMFDNRDPDVIGAPNPRRYAWLQVVYDFDGLRY